MLTKYASLIALGLFETVSIIYYHGYLALDDYVFVDRLHKKRLDVVTIQQRISRKKERK